MNNFVERTVKKEILYKGKVVNLELHDVELYDGSFSKREIIKHNGAVAILAITSDNEILLVEQYRKAIEKLTLEIPAGKLDLEENSLKCAVRELKEETGYDVLENKLKKIYDIHSSIGYSSEKITIYFVDNLKSEKKGHLSLDEDEFLNLKKYKIEKVYELLEKNIITDGKTVLALEWLKNNRK